MSPGGRFLVIVLIALAASPLTAPFAAGDLLELFGEETAVTATALKPPKTDDPVVALGIGSLQRGDITVALPAPRPSSVPVFGRSDISLPLRL